MNRFALLLLSLLVFTAGTAHSDDKNIRAVQQRLKQDGFYFGQANGVYDSQTSAAVSRYQIRNGLPITGRLDEKTTAALGVSVTANEPVAPDQQTWRELRKADQQFLQGLNKQGATSAPQAAGYNSVVVLSRERLRDYVAAFVLAGIDPQVGSELEFFADRVRYFNEGIVGRERIQRDLQSYAARWPQRIFSLAGEVTVEPQPDSRLRVTFPLRYELRNRSKHSSGKVRKTLMVEVTGDDLQIVAVDEAKAR